jgi:transketolase
MAGIINGMTLCGLRAFGSSFLVFSDYARGAIRLSSLMELPVIHIYTHDSIGVGEDGPTHQPIEHIPSLRAIPGLITIRPADANEVSEAWRVIIETKHNPVMLILTRQDIPVFDRAVYASASGLHRGGYILADCQDALPEVILIGSGSEVSLCIEAFHVLNKEGIKSRVVSLPSWELFDMQDSKYKNSVLPPNVTARVSVEMASRFGWERYVGLTGEMIGIDTFGASAPINKLKEKFGLSAGTIVNAAKNQLKID